MKKDKERLNLYIESELLERIKKKAKEDRRSVNSQILHYIELFIKS